MRAVDPEAKGSDDGGENTALDAAPEEVVRGESDSPAPSGPAAEPPPAPPVEDRTAALERELRETRDRMLRVAADFDNYRKRARREGEDAARRAREDTLLAVLAVADNLERALDHADERNSASVIDGVRLVHRQLLAVLEKLDVRPYDSVGSAFDPEEHHAVGQLETGDLPPGSVAREMQRGYRVGSRVLRPAMVIVAQPAAAEPAATAPDGPPGEDAGEEG